ncbi:MAG: hypothetical protein MRZ45_09310 [Blautia sp.]|nr:hypothetical protein [Blautia sp.]
MAAKTERKKKETAAHICSMCGKEIHGEHVYIRTRRRTDMHIHPECMNTGGKNGRNGEK